MTAPDGNLPTARRHLADAVSALIDPRPETRHLEGGRTTIEWLDSLYDQLCDEIPGSQGNRARTASSTPPLCIDAAELRTEIDTAVSAWEPHWPIPLPSIWPWVYEDIPPTVGRLQALAQRCWRPQDVHGIDQISTNIESWCEAIRELLNPTPRWHLPNPCPACDQAVVYRKNTADETVRQPALQIGPNGCECQHCHTRWAPEYFQHLANVLGYPLPNGVLA